MSKHLQNDLAHHLLQPEVSTVEIVDVYVQVINALREIDPTNVLLERVASQIKSFLDGRDDAVRIVVSSLLQPGADEEVHPNPSTEQFSGQVSRLMYEYISEERKLLADMNTWVGKDLKDMNWMPEPIDAGPSKFQHEYLRFNMCRTDLLRLPQIKTLRCHGPYGNLEKQR